MEKKIIETRQIFKESSKILGIDYMAKHWKKSRRQIYSWAADPNHCEVFYANPLEKIKVMLIELKKKGADNIVISALHLLANPLGYEITAFKISDKVKKETAKSLLKEMIISISELMKIAAEYYDAIEYKDDGKIKNNLYVSINQIKFRLTEIQIALNKDVEK